MHHRIVIVGAGTAGISVAARLGRAGEHDVALIDPAHDHYYQPLWTLVGAGITNMERTKRAQSSVMPKGVRWIQDAVVEFEPEERAVRTSSGARVTYDVLIVCPGIELAWDLVPGLSEAMSTNFAASNYASHLAPKNAELVRRFRGGEALFAAPGTPIKCPGAPQKATYLASDYWQRTGKLDGINVTFATGAGGIFGVPEFARVLEGVVERYGINTRFSHELVEVDPDQRTASFEVKRPEGTIRETFGYDFLHVAPPQRAPKFIRDSSLAGASPLGWIPVDRHRLTHVRYPEIYALGDVSDAPTSKTGAAIRRQAPVVVANVLSTLARREPTAHYDGYAACPFTTARGKMVLAEFDYSLSPHPTIPFINTQRERSDMWFVKRYGLPAYYWNVMLRGRG
jgi:sulfide:quinone oxidoreductase